MDQPKSSESPNHECKAATCDQDNLSSPIVYLWHWAVMCCQRTPNVLAKVVLWVLHRLNSLDGLVVLFVLFVMVPLLIFEVRKYPSIVVDPISVPPGFARIGYTPDVVARRLVDGINEFPAEIGIANLCLQYGIEPQDSGNPMSVNLPQRGPVDLRERGPVDLRDKTTVTGLPDVLTTHDPSRSDFVVPGMGLSLGAVAAYLRNRFHPSITVSGELLHTVTSDWAITDNYVSLRLRVNGNRIEDINRDQADEIELEQLFREGSRQVIEKTDPSRLDPKFAKLYNDFGLLLIDNCDHNGAVEKFRKAAEIDPQLAETYSLWGYVLGVYLGNHDGAVEKFRKAAEIDPQLAETYGLWGYMLGVYLDDHNGAVEKFRKAAEIDPEFAGTYNYWGLLYLEREENNQANDQAIEKFKRATEIDPDFAEAFYNWGYVLGVRKGQYVEATKKFERANEIRSKTSR